MQAHNTSHIKTVWPEYPNHEKQDNIFNLSIHWERMRRVPNNFFPKKPNEVFFICVLLSSFKKKQNIGKLLGTLVEFLILT